MIVILARGKLKQESFQVPGWSDHEQDPDPKIQFKEKKVACVMFYYENPVNCIYAGAAQE